jgi:hypothetical protein
MVNQQLLAPDVVEENIPVCRHHWEIQAATGPISFGTCRLCGRVKEFKNYVEASHWGDDKAGGNVRPELFSRAANLREEFDEEEN